MRGISFDHSPAVTVAAVGRMDVVCFAGFTPLRVEGHVPPSVQQWWREHGWLRAKEITDVEAALPAGLPVPVESWDSYQDLFARHRLNHRGEVKSQRLSEPFSVPEDDRELHVIVDREPQTVRLSPDADGMIDWQAVADQINSQLVGASASVEPGQHPRRLVIERTRDVSAGEISVYRNVSLGIAKAQQDDAVMVDNYLSVAVKEFFQQGGRTCYVIRMGDPPPLAASEEEKVARLFQLVWGSEIAGRIPEVGRLKREDLLTIALPEMITDAHSVKQWHGLAHVMGLPDVTYVCLPDLVDLLGAHEVETPAGPTVPEAEVFVECSKGESVEPWYYTTAYGAPVSSRSAYGAWKRVIMIVLRFLSNEAPYTQLLTSLPMPDRRTLVDLEEFVTSDLLCANDGDDVLLRRLQVAFPWLRTHQSDGLPDRLEPPEGALAGLLARKALTEGAYRSAAGSPATFVYDVAPRETDPCRRSPDTGVAAADRISWFEIGPNGIDLSSDVTAVFGPTYRYAVVRRIMIMVQRAAHELGLSHVFDVNSTATWRTIEGNLSDLLLVIYQKNGLRGRSSLDAFSVVCDRTTMSQNDIDSGRLVANITLQPAVPVERIAVDLLLARDGSTALRSAG
jgi:hypothetical protein